MKEQGLTQAELAKLANISQASLSAIVNGGSKPKAETLASLASALGVSVAELESEDTAELEACPRCGSHALTLWQSFAEPMFRLRCEYCGLDSGDQKSMEKAKEILQTFKHSNSGKHYTSDTRVLALSEVLDSSCYSADDVRPVWFENRGLFVVPSLLQCGTTERQNELCRVLWFDSSPRSFLWEKYNMFWRVWSTKPTDGLVELTQWDE